MAFNPTGVDDAVAGLVVSGLTIYTQATLPDSIDTERAGACLYPAADFIAGLSMSAESVGANTPAMEINYTLNYNLAYVSVGAGRMLKDWLRSTTDLAELFMTAVMNNQHSLSATHVLPAAMQSAMVDDPIGKKFLGATISLSVREYLNL